MYYGGNDENDIKTAFFREFTHFGQHVLTQYVTSSDMVLVTWKELPEVSFPKISWTETPYWLRGLRKSHFFAL